MIGRKYLRLFVVLLAVSVAKYLWLALFAHPVADDFCYAAKSAGQTLWDWSFSEWLYWNGRFASNLFMINGPLTWFPDMLTGYRLMPILLILLTFLACWLVIHKATQGRLSRPHELLGALAWLALFLNLMPDLGEGFYWYTGAITYQLGNILLLCHVALLLPSRRGWRSVSRLLLNLLLAVVIVGMDEIHMLLMVGLHLGRGVWQLVVRKRAGTSLLFLPVVIGAALLMVVAPGNAVRGALFADTHLPLRSLGMSAMQSIRFTAVWTLSPALLIAALLYLRVHRSLVQSVPGFQSLLRLPFWMAAVLPFLLVMATTFPAYWSTGLLGQHRTINVACLLFIPSVFLLLAMVLERHPAQKLAHLPPAPKQVLLTLALALVAFNFTRNDYRANADLWSGRVAEYDRVMLQRESQMRAAAADPSVQVVFVRLAAPPSTLRTYEEDGPLRDWMMHCEARFFGAGENQVVMEDPAAATD